jgi:hypothetical protein
VANKLWSWVYADPDARAFLEGKADPPTPDGKPGMRINPAYTGQVWPAVTFPKSDLYCVKMRGDGGQQTDWCTLDMHPYTIDVHEAARAAGRGDTLVRRDTARDSQDNVIGWKKGAPQAPGQRAVLAVADAATAARYGLPTAKLRNSAGAFVAPTTEGLLAGVATMKPGAVASVLEPDPAARAADAYPLTMVSYATTAPSALNAAAGADRLGHRAATFPRACLGRHLPSAAGPDTRPIRGRTATVMATVPHWPARRAPVGRAGPDSATARRRRGRASRKPG